MTDPIQIPNLVQLINPPVSEPPASAGAHTKPAPGTPGIPKDFKTVLPASLEEVNRLQTEADTSVQKLINGETDNVAEVLTAVNKAGIAFDLLMEARNRLAEAYREIQQMRI